VSRWIRLAGLFVAQAAAAAPGHTISLALGLPAAELGWQVRASDRLAFGARLAWDQLDSEESLSLSAVGITAPARLDLVFEHFAVWLEAAPGARRIAGRFREASCGCIVDTSPAYALHVPLTASLRVPLSEVVGLTLFSTLGSDLLLSGGLLVSPQVGGAADAAVSPAVSLGLMARAGRMFVLGDNVDPAVLGGRRAITMPLALLLTIAVRL
jgi:hypothetical protein